VEQFLEQIYQAAGNSPPGSHSMLGTVIALVMAAVLGGLLALIYDWTYTGKRLNRAQFSYTLVLLCLGGALVWLIVADNLARAFGLAGALALIRYRTRMRDPKDTTMVFFAMVVGMACGLHQYFNAVFGTFFIGLVLSVIHLVNRSPAMRGVNGNGTATKEQEEQCETGDEPEDGDDVVVL
jgi:MFS superfamily sulfate permease-like transporter